MDIINMLNQIDAFVWGPVMICLLLGSHIFLTIRTGFIQRKLPLAIKMSVVNDEGSEGDVSQFGALATALASTIGTGSIVGVATAIISGGPGAVFWMWLTGVFGIATKYAEVYASVRYRVKDSGGEMLGGAMYAWERAFKRKDGSTPWWAKLGAVAFALFAVVATIGTGSAVQSAAMTGIIESSIPGIPTWIIALVIAIAVALVIFGGIKGIANVCEKLVPFMAVAYTAGCLFILVYNWQFVGQAIVLIFECAFTAKAAFGGAVGSGIMVALQFGCARGLFSNESGLGSAPIVAAAAATKNPARQALVAMTGTFWSTVVICALTGIVLVATMLANPGIVQGESLSAGRGAVQRGVRHHPRDRHAGAGAGHDLLRVLHGHRLELLRQPLRHLSVRPQGAAPLPGGVRDRGLPGRHGRGRRGVDHLRHRQCADGGAQHHYGASAVGPNRARDQALHLRGQSGRGVRGRDSRRDHEITERIFAAACLLRCASAECFRRRFFICVALFAGSYGVARLAQRAAR